MERRRFLAAAGASLSLGGAAGCAAPTDPATSADAAQMLSGADWPMHGFDRGNTGYNPGAEGPETGGILTRSKVTGKWTLPAPGVADGTLLVGSRPFLYAWRVGGAFRWRVRVDTYTHHFTPAVADGTVLFASKDAYQEDAPGEGFVYAVDLATGGMDWRVPASVTGAPAPAPRDGRFYHTGWSAESARGHVRARSLADGAPLWTAPVAERDPAPVRSAVALDGDRVFVTAAVGPEDDRRGRVLALDAADGSERWRTDLAAPVRADPVVADGRVYAGTLAGDLVALDADDGSEAWRASTPRSIHQRPAVADGVVYLLTPRKHEAVMDVYALDAADGERRWHNSVEGAPAGIAVAGDRIYVGGGLMAALDAVDGEVAWRIPITYQGGQGGAFGPPAVVGDAVLTGACIKHADTGYKYDNYLYAFG
jgi:outer membrane protein assembly factor BamB